MVFEIITQESLEIVMDIVNSNSSYNVLENGNPLRTIQELSSEFLNSSTESYLVKHEERYIGIIDFLNNNPKDNHPWIGLLMIHRDYHSMGYGKKAYLSFEEKIIHQKLFKSVRLAVIKSNKEAIVFWKSLGFKFYDNSEWDGRVVGCYEKHL
ncbi:GNAT family N-acetyltransferase [Halobacillus seohaensis]|uniref:GNAT family N-acetyltransferase n=1 Tax=Halobacillus seohaensis TaxID=447421 RepID=A0ABW2EMU5_9BACI